MTLLLACAGLLVAGCAGPAQPQVTFYSHGVSVDASAARFCDPGGEHCAPPQPDAIRQLRVPAREPVQISVPSEVANTPWQIAFIYRTASGGEVRSRTPVFAPHKQFAYTLHLPPDGTHLDYVEVQQYSGTLIANPEGGVDFALAGSWGVNIT